MNKAGTLRRVLMTTDAVGGVWTYSLELAAGLAAKGVETSLVVLGPKPSMGQVAQAANVPGLSLITPGLELEWQDRSRIGASEVKLLHTLANAIQPDIVHVNGFREAACGWQAPVVLVAHSCVRSWWQACRGGEPPAEEWGDYLAGVHAGLRAADAVVAPTAAFMAELGRLYGELPRAQVIRNGRRPSIPAARRKPFILAAGRLWDEAKNVAALAAIADELPWPVMVAGEAGERERQAGVVHLGLLPEGEMLQRMAEAKIFAAPTRYEPFGLAILEAASAGAALVLSDLPALRELWDGAACFVPVDDRTALAATLQRLIADVPARNALQAAARARSRRYGPGLMVDSYLALYAQLTSQVSLLRRGGGLMRTRPRIGFYGSSLVSAYWNGAATYYRGLLKALAARGYRITFFEPDAHRRQEYRDIPDPPWAEVVVWPATPEGLDRALARAGEFDVVVKASGVGAFDPELEAGVLTARLPHQTILFWDVDAPATLDRLHADPADPFRALVPRYDLVCTYGGGDAVVGAYRELGARDCVPVYNALDPETHFPEPPDARFAASLGFLGNRMPDREARVDAFLLEAARRFPKRRSCSAAPAGKAESCRTTSATSAMSAPPTTTPSTAPSRPC